MGIRIHKEIGNYLSQEALSILFVDHYQEILEAFDYNENQEVETFFTKLGDIGESFLSEEGKMLASIEFKQLVSAFEDKKLTFNDLVSQPYFDDDHQGIVLHSIYSYKSKRYDDLIDYYEERGKMEDRIDLLHSAIYPVSGYIYLGGLENYDIGEKLVKGKVYMEHMASLAYSISKQVYGVEFDFDDLSAVNRMLTEKKFFHPCIDETLFAICKCAGLLKEDITELQFKSLVEPAILTYWS